MGNQIRQKFLLKKIWVMVSLVMLLCGASLLTAPASWASSTSPLVTTGVSNSDSPSPQAQTLTASPVISPAELVKQFSTEKAKPAQPAVPEGVPSVSKIPGVDALKLGEPASTPLTKSPDTPLPDVTNPVITSIGTSSLTVEQVVLAKNTAKTGVRLIAADTDLFDRGDTVYLVLRNVGRFKPGADGKHQLDMDVEVKDSTGRTIVSQKGVLGEKGRVALPNDTAPTLFSNVNTSPETDVGTYTVSMTIYDTIGGGKLTKSEKFLLK